MPDQSIGRDDIVELVEHALRFASDFARTAAVDEDFAALAELVAGLRDGGS